MERKAMKNEANNTNGAVAVSTDTTTEVNALDFIDQKFTDEKERDIAYDIVEDIAVNAACCDAEIDNAEVDEDAVIVYMYAPCEIVDNGIGPYEFWGCRCVDHRYEPEVDECAFAIAPDEKYLATLGLTGTATTDGDIDYDGCEEDGDNARCCERVTLFVTNPAKFWLYLDKEIAKRVAAKTA